jgi:hypothetical protein
MDIELSALSDKLGERVIHCLKMFGALEGANEKLVTGADVSVRNMPVASPERARNPSGSMNFISKPQGEQALEYTRTFLRGDCVEAFQKLIETTKTIFTEVEFRWRNDRHLNILKSSSGKRSSTAVMIKPLGDHLDIHLYFEGQTPRQGDKRLRNSTSDNTRGKRALMLSINKSSDVDAAVSIPRQSRGLSYVSRSKRLEGSLTRPQSSCAA